jgi:hypothetical protein
MTAYARKLAQAAGVIEARDLEPGDRILIRLHGESERTAQTVQTVRHEGGAIDYTVAAVDHVYSTSPRMPIALALSAVNA